MEEQQEKVKLTPLQRVARIWSAIVIVFAILILIGELAFPHTGEDYPPIENLLPVLMMLSVASLGLAWKRELLGGILNIVFFLANYVLYWVINARPFPLNGLAILSLAVVPGILFVISWRRSRPVSTPES
ncbi:MAG: hypothetical protein PVF83_09400 [Anaerolineales bacterium]|jgi:hypothetical protein